MSISTPNQGPSLLQRTSDKLESGAATRTEAPAASAPVELPEIDSTTTGVVFVHGIGDQARAEILLGWSRPIVQAVADWASSRPAEPDGRTWSSDRVVRSQIDFDGSGMPLVTIRVPQTTDGKERFPAQTWVMTEARWAQDVEPPTLETMIDWCGPRGVVATVVERIVERSMASESRVKAAAIARQAAAAAPAARRPVPAAQVAAATADPRKSAGRALAEMGLSSIVSVVVTFGLLGYALARTVAGVIPYKPLQDALARISLDSFLTTWWGDVYVLLDDPVQAANIRGQVAKTIRALRAFGCMRIVVVAHSGGTIVSYMALSDPALSETADTLVTHGQAIQMGRTIHTAEGEIRTSPGVRIERGLPLRIGRWRDFHATHDPAPAGRLEEADPATPPAPGIVFEDTEVWNRMSIAADHGEYFSNDEEFVDELLTEIETVGRPGAPSRFAPERDARIERRQQRVFTLALWRRLMFVVPLMAIMTAFLTPSEGLIPELRDAAGSVATFLPGSSELISALHGLLPPPGEAWFLTAAATLFAVLYMLAIVQAVLPIGRSEIWPGWRKVVFIFLDFGVFFVGLAVALVVRVVAANDPARGVSTFVSRLGDTPLQYGFLIVIAIFLVLAVGPLRRGLDTLSRKLPLATRLAVVMGALVVLGIAVGGIVIDENIRKVVSASGVAIVMFQVLARIGAWRWARWDESERSIARRRSDVPFRRWTIWLEFLLLGSVVTGVGLAIGLGRLSLLGASGAALGILLGAFVISDVVGRKPAAAASRAPGSGGERSGSSPSGTTSSQPG
ncbi:MAG TPA: hypothetical protein VF323_00340 [Candidatus Limnocylindrales bacterium]